MLVHADTLIARKSLLILSCHVAVCLLLSSVLCCRRLSKVISPSQLPQMIVHEHIVIRSMTVDFLAKKISLQTEEPRPRKLHHTFLIFLKKFSESFFFFKKYVHFLYFVSFALPPLPLHLLPRKLALQVAPAHSACRRTLHTRCAAAGDLVLMGCSPQYCMGRVDRVIGPTSQSPRAHW